MALAQRPAGRHGGLTIPPDLESGMGSGARSEAQSFPCTSCGGPVVDADREGDWMCAHCGKTHFANREEAPSVADSRLPLEAPASVHPEAMAGAEGREAELRPERVPDTRPYGRPRSFWACVALGIVSLGIYFLYWQVRVFAEVDQQERRRRWVWLWWLAFAFLAVAIFITIDSASRLFRETGSLDEFDDPVASLILLLLGQFCSLAYIALEGANLEAASQRRGIAGPAVTAVLALLAISGTLHLARLAFSWPSVVEFLVLPLDLVAYATLQGGLNRYWEAVRSQSTLSSSAARPA